MDLARLRLFFWLKWKIVLRGYQRNTTAAIGMMLGILVFVPVTGLVAVASYLAFTELQPQYAEHALRGVLLGSYMFWILSPLLGFALNESFDVTKLFVYPVSVRQILVGAVAGSMLDFPVLFILPSLVAALIGFSSGPSEGLLIAIALALFLAHTLSLGQSIVLATAGMLRSRKYRDLLVVLIPLVWIVYYIFQELMRRGSIRINWSDVFESRAWTVVSYLPPGLAARAVVSASHHEPVTALLWTALLLAVTSGTVLLASAVIQKVYAGDTDVFRVRKGKPADHTEAPREGNRFDQGARLPFGLKLPAEAEAIYLKESRYMARDPSFKAAAMNLIYTLMVAVFMAVPRSGETAIPMAARWSVWPAACVVLLAEMRFFFNYLGTEGAAAAWLFLSPAPRRRILAGKNAIYFSVVAAVNAALAVILCAVSGGISELPYLAVFLLLATGFYIASGNLMSVLFPMRSVSRGWKVKQNTAGQGCAYGFLYVGVSIGLMLALIPIAAALIVPRVWIGPVWLVLTVPLSIAYVVGAYLFSLDMASRLLLERETDVIRKLGAED